LALQNLFVDRAASIGLPQRSQSRRSEPPLALRLGSGHT